jgi:hypothetical protein
MYLLSMIKVTIPGDSGLKKTEAFLVSNFINIEHLKSA